MIAFFALGRQELVLLSWFFTLSFLKALVFQVLLFHFQLFGPLLLSFYLA